MRTRIALFLALMGTLFALTAGTSHASDDSVTVVSAQTNDEPFLNSYKVWSPSVCMSIGDTGLNAAPLAQGWNNATVGDLAITASANCVSAGYPPSRRFTIDAYNGSTSYCFKVTDKNVGTLDAGTDVVASGGKWLYVDNPILWINRNCWTSIFAQRHFTSAGIGSFLGLAQLNSSGYNSRVVNHTAWSRENVEYADQYSGAVLDRMYG